MQRWERYTKRTFFSSISTVEMLFLLTQFEERDQTHIFSRLVSIYMCVCVFLLRDGPRPSFIKPIDDVVLKPSRGKKFFFKGQGLQNEEKLPHQFHLFASSKLWKLSVPSLVNIAFSTYGSTTCYGFDSMPSLDMEEETWIHNLFFPMTSNTLWQRGLCHTAKFDFFIVHHGTPNMVS